MIAKDDKFRFSALLLTLLLGCSIGLAAQDLPFGWPDSGWWLVSSNDSFAQGLIAENDDLHTYGFAFGRNWTSQTFAVYWDVYTWRGSEADSATRADRLLLLWQSRGAMSAAFLRLNYEGGPTLAFQGGLGGGFVQKVFHEVFGNFRPVPGAQQYDSFQVLPGAHGSLALAYDLSPWSFAVQAGANASLSLPSMAAALTFRLGFMVKADGQGQELMAGLHHSWLAGCEASPARDRTRTAAADWQFQARLLSGPLFYSFAYGFDGRYADGLVGYLWRDSQEAAGGSLWQAATLGLYVFMFRPAYHFHEQLYVRLHFDDIPLSGTTWFLELRNGGAYHSLADDIEIRLWQVGVGLEYEHALPAGTVFAQLAATAGLIEASDFNAYRGVSSNTGFSSWICARSGYRLAFMELGLFAEFSPYTGGMAVPAYAIEPRWGFVVGLHNAD